MSDLVVVTSAAGGVGRPLVERLAAAGEHVRAFVKNDEQADVARRAGAAEVVVGDLRASSELAAALRGAGRAYHAAPTQIIDEQPLLDAFVEAATSGDLRHLVFHSVVHPDLHVLPHHHQKDVAEQRLHDASVPVTGLWRHAKAMYGMALRAIIAAIQPSGPAKNRTTAGELEPMNPPITAAATLNESRA